MLVVNKESCVGCGRCLGFCTEEALCTWWGYAEVDAEKCTECGVCTDNCPVDALSMSAHGLSQQIGGDQ